MSSLGYQRIYRAIHEAGGLSCERFVLDDEAEGKPLETGHILGELGATRPLAVVRAEKVHALRVWARERTVPTD